MIEDDEEHVVIPNTTKTVAILFFLCDDHEEELYSVRYPVVGWRVYKSGDAEPIIADSTDIKHALCLEAEGFWTFPGLQEHTSLKDAENYARNLLKKRPK